MAKTDFKSVDQYIKSKGPSLKPVLDEVRKTIRKALPKAEEVISYQIPAYRLPEGLVIFFAGWSEHFSVYPASERMVSALKKELSKYQVSKGTIRFPLADGVPTKLIARIAQLRAEEVLERAAAKKAGKGKAGKATPAPKPKRKLDEAPAKKSAKVVEDKPAKKAAPPKPSKGKAPMPAKLTDDDDEDAGTYTKPVVL